MQIRSLRIRSRSKTPQLLTLIPLFLVASSLIGQTSQGVISGTVTDPSGSVVQRATVTITDEGNGVSRQFEANAQGFFDAEGIQPGTYTLTVTATGFNQAVTKGILIDPGQRRQNDITLSVGGANATVSIEADALQLQTQSSESGGTISQKQISNLMLNGRNFQALGQLVPGVSSTQGGNASGFGALSQNSLIVNGQPIEYTVYLIDGAYDLDPGNLADSSVTPTLDGIQEFRILKDNYSAKYGLGASGLILVETRSGTSKFHGTAWEYLRNNAFDANNYFTSTQNSLHQNIYGYVLGGPLFIPHVYNTDRKKTFFFASNEWHKSSIGATATGTVFSPAMRTGDFSSSPTLPSGGLTLDSNSQTLLASEGLSNCLLGPTTINPACLNPVSVGIMNAYVPTPNYPNGGVLNYINQESAITDVLNYQYRFDHYFTPNEQLTARIIYANSVATAPGLPATTTTQTAEWGYNALARLTSIFSPTIVNSFTYAYLPETANLTALNQSMPAGLQIKQAFPGADTLNRIPWIAMGGGYASISTGYDPIRAGYRIGTISDDFSWVKSQHVLQFGGIYLYGNKPQTTFNLPQGQFSFTGTHTGDPAADYLLGLDATYFQSNNQNLGHYRYNQTELYAQDDWKATSHLTLNMGLRWVIFAPDTVDGNKVTNFSASNFNPTQAPVVTPTGELMVNSAGVPVTQSGTPANLVNGLVTAGSNGVPSGFYTRKFANLAPRIGFAYSFPDGKTAIHGGYGIGYTRLPIEQIYTLFGTNPPFNQNANILNSLISNGTAGVSAPITPQALAAVTPDYKPTQFQTFSLTGERQLSGNLVASIAYAGNVSDHLELLDYDQNFPLPVSAPSAPGCLTSGLTAGRYQFDPCINTGTVSPNFTRPYAGYAGISTDAFVGRSNYHALQGGLIYKTSPLQVNIAYTYSKTLATVAARGAGSGVSLAGDGIQNPRDIGAEYGPPSYDRTHVFTSSIVYDLPFFEHADSKLVRTTLGGWSISGIVTLERGYALTPSNGTTTAGLAIRPNLMSSIHKVGKESEWFSTDSFSAPAYGVFGNASTGSIRGPGELVGNTALYKTFPIHEEWALQFRAEAFNVANHPNFSNVSTAFGTPTFGRVTSAQDPRILEFALRLNF